MWRSREQPHITHKVMVWLTNSTVPFSSSSDPMLNHRTTGNATCPWFCVRTGQQPVLTQEPVPSCSCLADPRSFPKSPRQTLLMLHHTLATTPPNSPNFRIWSNPIWPQLPKTRRQHTTSTSCGNRSQPETRYGCQYSLRGSWILGGKEDGKSSQSRAQKMWRSRTAKHLMLCAWWDHHIQPMTTAE